MGMLEDDFFVRFVSIFQDVGTSLLDDADNLENVVDVTVAPPPVVRLLGSWIGVDAIDSSLDHELQRKIVRESGQILAWRGTRRGLEQFLRLVTDGPVEIEESGGVFAEGEAGDRPPFVRITLASTGWAPEPEFVRLLRDELPAHVTFEVWIGDRLLWPAAAAPAPWPETPEPVG
jgi:phage tail-like protein